MQHNNEETDLPKEVGKPATRALTAAGFHSLDQFTETSEAELLKLHGVGPKATRIIGQALAEKGMAYKSET